MTEKGYWFAWKAEDGTITLEGPWPTQDKANEMKTATESHLTGSAKCGDPFYAHSFEDARNQAHTYLP